MIPPRLRRRWLLLVPLAVVTGATEAAAAAGIFALIAVLSDAPRGLAIPWVAALVRWLPAQSPQAVVLQLTGLLGAYAIAKSLFLLRIQYLRVRIAHDSNAHLACEMLRRYLAAPYPFHLRRHSSELIRNCTSSVAEVLGGVLGASVSLAGELLMAAGLVLVLVATSPGVSIVGGVGLIGVMLLMLRLTRHAAARAGSDSHELAATTLKGLQQALAGIKELKVLGREHFFYEEFAERQRQLLMLGFLGVTLSAVPPLAIQTVLLCGAFALVAILTVLGQAGTETLPVAAVFGYAGLRILPMANGMVLTFNGIRASRRAVDEIYDDFVTLGERDAAPAAAGPHLEFHDSIVLSQVSYVYPGAHTRALDGVSLTIRRGESIGIVGATGAGKSTLVDVILGLLPPTHGKVRVDGVDVGPGSAPWKRRVGYVPQSVFLIDDTLRRNVALGIRDDAIDGARVSAALGMAQLSRFVATLPEGVETMVGERGVRLSGGERQRVAIARALYHDPDLIVFDEATASLDVATESEVTAAIESLRGVKTMIVITHRLSTVKRCDRLVWLHNARVVGVGSFDDLRRADRQFDELATLAAV